MGKAMARQMKSNKYITNVELENLDSCTIRIRN